MRPRALALLVHVVAAGLACAPALACTDFTPGAGSRWTIERTAGVAWLVTPCGERFFSIGVNTLDGGTAGEAGYDWKRSASDLGSWASAVRTRLRDWGFNTAGGTSLAPDALALPQVADLELGRTARFHWVDPFDPATAPRMRRAARRLVAPYASRAYRIGYFSDNEVGWWSGALFAYYLEQPGTSHTKRRLVALLRVHYGDDWTRFTRDFVPPPGVASFDALVAATRRPTLRPGGDGMRVVRRWTAVVARRYYRLAAHAIHAADPEALLFGDRLPIYYDPAAVRAMAPWVDAIATNYNVDSPDGWIAPYYFDGLRRLGGNKPILVSEWFFAATENRTGNRNNGHLMTVATQAARALGAATAAARFAALPSVLGAHWFQYYDHPRGGRFDGEDYNFGLVDVDDRPYDELVDAFRRVNRDLPRIHASARPIGTRPPAIPYARIDVDDRSLADWPKDEALVGGLVAGGGDVPFADVLVSWDERGVALAVVGMDYHAPELLPRGVELPRSECFRVEWGVDAGHGARRFALRFVPPPAPASPDERYAMRVELCATNGERCTAIRGGHAVYFGADQPRLVAEAHLPWRSLGVSGTPPADLRLGLGITGFHRARSMSSDGARPADTLRDPRTWRKFALSHRA
jgi:hypothetical protein